MPTRIESLLPLNKTSAHVVGLTQMRTKTPRRVSFQPTEFSAGNEQLPSRLTLQERNQLWYQQNDLVAFKNEAREISRSLRRNSDSTSRIEASRGLEHRISMDRQKNKYLAIRAILKAQDSCQSPQELAQVASKCTAWAKEVALLTGHADYYEAYNPHLAHLVPTTPSMPQPLLLQRKRPQVIVIDDGGSSSEDEARRVRPRLSSPPRRVGFVTATL